MALLASVWCMRDEVDKALGAVVSILTKVSTMARSLALASAPAVAVMLSARLSPLLVFELANMDTCKVTLEPTARDAVV